MVPKKQPLRKCLGCGEMFPQKELVRVVKTKIKDESGAKSCRVIVPDSQLSLAIGNKGQNVRLAAKLTGWKIDIKPLSQAND